MSGGIDPGCIRVGLSIDGERVARIEVSSDRPRASAALVGRKADEAVRLVPLLFALCGKAQGRAAELALAAARGASTEPRLDNPIAAEAMREHLWRWLLDLPSLLGAAPMKEEFAAGVGWIAQERRDRLAELLADPRLADLERALEVADSVLDSTALLLPGFPAQASLRHWPRLDASFSRQPCWQGGAAETGALARCGASSGPALAMRWRARREELADWAQGRARIGGAGTASSAPVTPGVGRALVETARGLLMHEIALDGDRVGSYVIVAPTEWNFHPQGPLVRWLTGCDATDRAVLKGRVALAVATLDPCVRWELAGL